MRRFILATVAMSMLAGPSALAADGYRLPSGHNDRDRHVSRHHGDRWDHKDRNSHVVIRKHVDRRPHWKNGERLSTWQHQRVVRDYHRYGLRKPGRGQQWVQVGNDYILVSIFSGIIAGIIAGH